jgi:hypothetical protein
VFPTSFAPSEEDRRAIDLLKGDGRVLVFLWNVGLYLDGALDEKGMEALTGIRFRTAKEPVPLRVKIRGGHPLTDGLDGVEYGVDHATWPVPFADDPDARVLGVLADGRPALVAKERDGWTAIHSTAPCLLAELLRRIARRAGVYLYVDTEDVVWATRGLVAVSVVKGGRRTIRLPRRSSVRGLFDGEEIGTDLTTFDAGFPDLGTRVFVVK